MLKLIFLIIILNMLFISFAQPVFRRQIPLYTDQTLYDLINEKEENIDVGHWALIIANEFDNSIDVNKYLIKLDEMAEEIKRMLAGRTNDMDKFLAVKCFYMKQVSGMILYHLAMILMTRWANN
jgi:hypothetical protein